MSYFGGKSQDGVYHSIINQIPIHKVYIESFLGGGGIFKNKEPAIINIGLDLCREALSSFNDIDNMLLLNQSFFDFFKATPKGNFTYTVPDILKKRSDKVIFNFTGSEPRYRTANSIYPDKDVFVYCDPPYPLNTRGKTRYKFDFTDKDHIEFLNIIKILNYNVAVSTYPNDLYDSELSDWRCIEYNSTNRAGVVRTENLFMNYPEPHIIHDYTYIGENSGQRQSIKRRIKRNVKKILDYTSRERVLFLKKLINELPDYEKKYFGIRDS